MHLQTQENPRTVVYVACARGNEIVVFDARPDDGALEIMERVALGPGVTPLTVHPDRGFLYAGLRAEESSVMCFAIDGLTGALRLHSHAPLTDPPMYLTTDASGAFLLSASYAGATFTINRVRHDGSVEPASVQRSPTPPQAHGIRTDRTNRFLFVTALGGDAILQYHFDPETGRATPNSVPFVAAPQGSGPRHLVFHPTADVLYVNGELDGSICSYALNPANGQLRLLSTKRMLHATENVQPWAAELAITPDGRFLYASERRTSIMTTFALSGEEGALLAQDRIETEAQPRSFAIDPGGRWLVVAGEKSNHVMVFAIDSVTGALTARQRYAVGEKPVWVSIVEL